MWVCCPACQKVLITIWGFELPTDYRVVDLGSSVIDPEDQIITGVSTPEAAAELALGVKLVRSGNKPNLRARVYFHQTPGGPLTMVRLYTHAIERSRGQID